MEITMKILALYVIIFQLGFISCVAGAIVKDNVTCPDGFQNIHRQCFRFINEKKTWIEAQQSCKTLNSDLATLEALYEKRAVNTVIEKTYAEDTKFWFGYGKREGQPPGKHVWEWISSGQKVQERIVPWFRKAFQKKPSRFCGGILFTPKSVRNLGTLFLDNGKCTEERFFVCEHHPLTRSKETTTDTQTSAATTTIPSPTTTLVTPVTTEREKKHETGEPKGEIIDEENSLSSSVTGDRVLQTPATAPCQGFGGTPRDASLYRSYLRSAIRENEAKVKYYLEVSRLYAEALEVQKRYYTSLQEKLDQELQAETKTKT